MFKGMNSLDTVEAVMVFEEAFGLEFPVDEPGEWWPVNPRPACRGSKLCGG